MKSVVSVRCSFLRKTSMQLKRKVRIIVLKQNVYLKYSQQSCGSHEYLAD